MKKLLVVSCLLLVVCLSGCGERQETTLYYSSPSFNRGGEIIFLKGIQVVNKDIIGTQTGSSFTQSISTMTTAGTSETFKADVTNTTPYYMSYSPTGDFVAYLDSKNGDLFNKIIVRYVGTASHSGLNVTELSFASGIRSFDWAADGNSLVYCTSTEIRSITLAGVDTLIKAVADLETVSWKYAGRIAYVHNVGADKVLSLIYSDGTGNQDLPVAASVTLPQISPANTNEVYGFSGGSYCQTSTTATTTTEILANCQGQTPRISPDGANVTYSKTATEDSGIYLLDLTTKAESKVK
ncbi:MAG: hypothetical protein ABIH50_04125 [bacterium]